MLILLACAVPVESPAPGPVDRVVEAVTPIPAIPARIAELVSDPGVIEADGVAGFRPIVLSNVAEGCVVQGTDEGRACVAAVTKMAMDPEHRPKRLASEGLWAAHTAIVLSAAEKLGIPVDAAFHRRLVQGLHDGTLRSATRHVPSYARFRARWPADEAAALYALWRYDRQHGTDLSVAPIAAWNAWMDEHGATRWGLPMSEVAGGQKTGKYPRGCALSWTVRYQSRFDPERAAATWSTYKQGFLMLDSPFAGFREYPLGVDVPADVDSGPIVGGIGAAATGIGIGAAYAMHDHATAARLEASAAVIHQIPDPELQAVGSSVLAQALEFGGRTAGIEW